MKVIIEFTNQELKIISSSLFYKKMNGYPLDSGPKERKECDSLEAKINKVIKISN